MKYTTLLPLALLIFPLWNTAACSSMEPVDTFGPIALQPPEHHTPQTLYVDIPKPLNLNTFTLTPDSPTTSSRPSNMRSDWLLSRVHNARRQSSLESVQKLHHTFLQQLHANPSLHSFLTITDNPKDADFILRGSWALQPNDPYNATSTYNAFLLWTLINTKTQTTLRVGHTPTYPHYASDTPTFASHTHYQAQHVTLSLISAILHSAPSRPPTPTWALSIPKPPRIHTDLWVVSIGIEQHRSSIPDALYASNDATAFADFAHRAWNVPKSNIKTLTNQDATHAAITSTLQEWLPKNVQPGDHVVLFLSGHGTLHPKTGHTHLVTYDTTPNYTDTTTLPLSSIYTQLSSLPSSNNLVLIDTCFSGTGPRSTYAPNLRPIVPLQPTTPPPNTTVLSATQANQTAQTAPNAPHGLFTYHLLSALYGKADRDGDRSISLQEAYRYISQRTQPQSQTPTLQTTLPHHTTLPLSSPPTP